MKKNVLISVVIAFVGIIFVLGITLIALRSNTSLSSQDKSGAKEEIKDSHLLVRIHDTDIKVDVVETPEERNKGLSGRESLANGEGMLFVFEKMDTYSFWMPDMHFAIDIIWLDENMKVMHIQENATPESYPTNFTPPVPAKYVLEVPAYFSKEKGIVVGDQALLQ